MQEPLVSICIPAYNAAPYIGATMRSALMQTYSNLEIIVRDDCSTDNTLQAVQQFDDPRIAVYENKQNLGVLANINLLLSYAKGDYVKLLCQDDLIMPDCIAKQVAAFENNADKNIALVTANKYIVDECGKRLFTKQCGIRGFMDSRRAVRKSILHGSNIFGEPGLPLMRADILHKTTGILQDKHFIYCYDFDLWCKMLLHGNLWAIDEPLFSFRIVGTSLTSQIAWKQAKAVRDYFSLIGSQQEYGISKTALFIGRTMVYAMCLARNAVYWWVNRRNNYLRAT